MLPEIKRIFLPLGIRLFYYESGNYLIDNTSIDVELVDESDFDYQEMMNKIGLISNVYDPTDVFDISKNYETRATQILEKLLPRKINLTYNSNKNIIIQTKTSKEEQESLMTRWKAELNYCIQQLQSLQNSRKTLVSNSNREETKLNYINLPEGFAVKNLVSDFTPILSVKQVTILLYYLRKTKIIPQYSDKALAELAKYFFARNEQNVREEFGRIHELKDDKNQIKELSDILFSFIDKLGKQ